MPLQKVHLENFRLFNSKVLSFSKGANLIIGPNGSGKTSILEALNILISGNSFREKDTKVCINQANNFFNLKGKGTLQNKKLELSASNGIGPRMHSVRKLNDKQISKSKILYPLLVIGKTLKMIDGEPDLRREHYNNLMFHVKPGTVKLYKSYQKALKQRNKCLKNKFSDKELLVWSDELSKAGLELSLQQYDFFKIFKENIKTCISDITESGHFEFLSGLNINFSKGWDRAKTLEESLKDSLDKDRVLGYTSKGPHRMDILYKVSNKMASSNLSRGQLKILILLIFLSNIALIENLTGAEAILMIDDLGSELDVGNLRYIVKKIIETGKQTILTGIEGEEIQISIKDLTNFTQINL